eukprot:TRINITY_DN120_c0_g1_i1.p1 TRINITY_DN120_c0_g1~~TRINITY_DN120_c0_g1_i1.p1  ORF type:complete len:716 (-),score=176.46 TRINITY_DN120_c0_g1_i1:77-2224(-)
MSYQESHLIGDILDEERPKGGKPVRTPLDKVAHGEFRSTSAPPVLPIAAPAPEVLDPTDPRLNPAYVQYYYQQRALNPRLPPPVALYPNPQQVLALMQQQAAQVQLQTQLASQYAMQQLVEAEATSASANATTSSLSLSQQPSPTDTQDPHPHWPLEDKPRSVVDKIQQDFPRTPSPAIGSALPPVDVTGMTPQQVVAATAAATAAAAAVAAAAAAAANSQPTQVKLAQPRPQHAQQQLLEQMQKLQLQSQPEGFVVDPMAAYAYQQYMAQLQLQQQLQQQYLMQQGFVPQMPEEVFYVPPGWDASAAGPPPQLQKMQHPRNHMMQQPQRAQRAAPTQRAPPPVSLAGGEPRGRPEPPRSPLAPVSTGEGLRSSLLEEFRTNKNREFELQDIVGYVVEFSTDQHGSRFIQQKLEIANDADKQMVFDEILPKALTLMTDVFGNYVIQKFFEHGSAQHKRRLANEVLGNVLPLTLQMYGCRVIQKALEVIDRDQQSAICKELYSHVLPCVKDQNGNHVIQKCIEKVPADIIQFIVDAFQGQVYNLATHAYGCRVIQRILEHCSLEQTFPVLQELLHHIHDLVQDQYGNYVIQHVLMRGKPEHRALIMQELRGNIVRYSQHKFASNVVEKCLLHGTTPQRDMIIDEIIRTNTGPAAPLELMMKDQYANYVVQRVLELANEGHRAKILQFVSGNIQMLKRYTFAKHILARIEKQYGKMG